MSPDSRPASPTSASTARSSSRSVASAVSPRGALPQRAGTTALGPLEHRAGPPRRERQAQPERGERVAVHGGAGTQLGGAEAEAVLVEHGEPGAQRPQRGAAAALRQAPQRLGVPRADAQGDGAAAPCLRHAREDARGLVVSSERERDALGEDLRVERRRRPAGRGERRAARAGTVVQLGCSLSPREGGVHRDVAGERRPARAALGAKLRGGLLGDGERLGGIVVGEQRLGQRQPRLGELRRHRVLLQARDRALRTGPCLPAEPRRQQRVAAIELEHAVARAGLRDDGLRGVEALQRCGQVAAARRDPAEVLQHRRRQQRLLQGARDLQRSPQVGLRRAQ